MGENGTPVCVYKHDEVALRLKRKRESLKGDIDVYEYPVIKETTPDGAASSYMLRCVGNFFSIGDVEEDDSNHYVHIHISPMRECPKCGRRYHIPLDDLFIIKVEKGTLRIVEVPTLSEIKEMIKNRLNEIE